MGNDKAPLSEDLWWVGAAWRRDMLKVRLMGTKREMKWFRRILERDRRFHIIRISEPYAIKGSSRFYRMYIELERSHKVQA